jgi:hypothetical protein
VSQVTRCGAIALKVDKILTPSFGQALIEISAGMHRGESGEDQKKATQSFGLPIRIEMHPSKKRLHHPMR